MTEITRHTCFNVHGLHCFIDGARRELFDLHVKPGDMLTMKDPRGDVYDYLCIRMEEGLGFLDIHTYVTASTCVMHDPTLAYVKQAWLACDNLTVVGYYPNPLVELGVS